jgi:hypothetical protein
MMPGESGFVDSHLDVEVDLPRSVEEMLLPDVYLGLEIDLMSPGDGIVTDRHHASADRYEPDDAMNRIEGSISPFTLSGWPRHGCEQVVQVAGATACHPGGSNADLISILRVIAGHIPRIRNQRFRTHRSAFQKPRHSLSIDQRL